MYPASAMPHPRFLRSRSLPSCCSGQLLPGHCDELHQRIAAGQSGGPRAYEMASLNRVDEAPLR